MFVWCFFFKERCTYTSSTEKSLPWGISTWRTKNLWRSPTKEKSKNRHKSELIFGGNKQNKLCKRVQAWQWLTRHFAVLRQLHLDCLAASLKIVNKSLDFFIILLREKKKKQRRPCHTTSKPLCVYLQASLLSLTANTCFNDIKKKKKHQLVN